MHDNGPQFARNTEAVARALGIKIPRQRRKRQDKLREVSLLTQHAKFPKKDARRGWPVLALQQFALDYAAEIADAKMRRAAASDILNNDDPNRKSVDLVKSLAARVAPGGGPSGEPRAVNSLTEIAYTIAQHFKVDVRKQYVDRWRKGESVPRGAPVFPPPDAKSNQYNVSECLAWYEKWILPSQNGNNTTPSLFGNLTEARDKNELEQIEHERWLRDQERRADDKNFVRRDVLLGMLLDAGKRASALATAAIEKRAVKLFGEALATLAIGLTPEQQMKITEIHRETCVAVNNEFQVAAGGLTTESIEDTKA